MTIDCGPCRIRSWQFGDEKNLHLHANSKAIWANLRDQFPYPYTADDAERWVQFAVDPVIETNFAIDVAGEAVGNIGLRIGDDIERHSAEVWYWLGETYWGRGIITAALKAITHHAFNELNLIRVYAMPFARNTASIKVLEKVGYKQEGLLRWSAIKDDVVLDKLIFAYLSSDWLNGKTTTPYRELDCNDVWF